MIAHDLATAVTEHVRVPMLDGACLAAVVHRPAAEEARPVWLVRTPYSEPRGLLVGLHRAGLYGRRTRAEAAATGQRTAENRVRM